MILLYEYEHNLIYKLQKKQLIGNMDNCYNRVIETKCLGMNRP